MDRFNTQFADDDDDWPTAHSTGHPSSFLKEPNSAEEIPFIPYWREPNFYEGEDTIQLLSGRLAMKKGFDEEYGWAVHWRKKNMCGSNDSHQKVLLFLKIMKFSNVVFI